MMAWVDSFAAKLPPELVAWARTQPDLATAWGTCPRVEWLVDLGTTLDLDETSRRALVRACAEVVFDDATFLRLTPSRNRIAGAWATHRNAASLDILGTLPFEDYKNGILVGLPIAVIVMLVLQYHFHVPDSVLRPIRYVALAALPGWGIIWGFARRRLTDRAIGRYRREQADKDVFEPVRKIARRLPGHQAAMLNLFRRGWGCVTNSATPQLSSS
jgi:hypothetical protein